MGYSTNKRSSRKNLSADPQDGSVRQIIAVAEKFLDAVPEGFEPWSDGATEETTVQRFIGVENRLPPKPEVDLIIQWLVKNPAKFDFGTCELSLKI